MSKLDELIKEYCPNGVEYKELKDILKIRNGSDYKSFPEGDIPVYGSGGVMTYIDRCSYDKPTVLIPRKGSIDKLYYIDTPFWNVDTIFYTEIFEDVALPKYVYHCLLREHLEQYNTAGGVPSLTQTVLNKVQIPVPPLPVQREIVRILDNFTELTAELQAELQARKKQYEYYREQLLTPMSNVQCEMCNLGYVVQSVHTGLNPRQFFQLNTEDATNYYVTIKEFKGGNLHFDEKTDRINDDALRLCNNRSNLEVGDVLFSGTGTIGETFVIEEKPTNWNIKEGVYSIKPKHEILFSRYLMHYLSTKKMHEKYELLAEGGTVKSISMKKMNDLEIAVPPLDIQKKIADTLDNFDAICSDLKIGLPAEIEARKLQYEYYRDKLLTFKEVNG